MKTFENITSAFNYIKKNLQTGDEKIINDRIHFGVSKYPYVYTNDAEKYNMPDLVINNGAFTGLVTDEQLERAISWTLQTDGYLAVS